MPRRKNFLGLLLCAKKRKNHCKLHPKKDLFRSKPAKEPRAARIEVNRQQGGMAIIYDIATTQSQTSAPELALKWKTRQFLINYSPISAFSHLQILLGRFFFARKSSEGFSIFRFSRPRTRTRSQGGGEEKMRFFGRIFFLRETRLFRFSFSSEQTFWQIGKPGADTNSERSSVTSSG